MSEEERRGAEGGREVGRDGGEEVGGDGAGWEGQEAGRKEGGVTRGKKPGYLLYCSQARSSGSMAVWVRPQARELLLTWAPPLPAAHSRATG